MKTLELRVMESDALLKLPPEATSERCSPIKQPIPKTFTNVEKTVIASTFFVAEVVPPPSYNNRREGCSETA